MESGGLWGVICVIQWRAVCLLSGAVVLSHAAGGKTSMPIALLVITEETVAYMPDDPFPGLGLRPVELADQDAFRPYFASLLEPLSDYTFSQIYTWRNSLHIVWKILDNHLCVFANGTGDLTLLIPPIGDTNTDIALKHAFELMDDYNAARGVPDRTRVEYASDELLGRLDRSRLDVAPMGTDYVYDVRRMIDLAGGDLASKRQAKNRFQRLYAHRVEAYDAAKHLDGCLALLEGWRVHQDAQHLEEPNANCIKRQKESIATELALRSASDLGFKGMVVQVQDTISQEWKLKGFTFGEHLGSDSSSIVIEKTDLEVKGLAQFIFSDFCRQCWADRPLTNVGDDWGLESLAWTKMSYRPIKLLQKYTISKPARVPIPLQVPTGLAASAASACLTIRAAHKDDLTATVDLEKACFSSDLSLKKRQLQYLQQRKSAVFLVAEQAGQVIGEGIALVRQHKSGISGRIYSLAVNEQHRGKKIGRQLLQAMVQALADRGVKRVYLEVEQSNTRAIALYEHAGFRSIGKLPNYYGPRLDGIHMMHDLTPAPTLFDHAAALS
jgi:ribosomal protein S18 acetylase RimI-like enzyme